MVKGKATICVVNYKTLEFTRLCLRSIRKFTKYPYEVVVIDNDSQDDSLEYLKSLGWIRLIERQKIGDLRLPIDDCKSPQSTICLTADASRRKIGGYAHAAGLDLGLANCNTEFFVSMHSDTFIQTQN